MQITGLFHCNFHYVCGEKTGASNQHRESISSIKTKQKKTIRNKHVLTNTQPLSYHFSHLGVNVFVATCQTPTCFEFSTRVLAPLPRSTGNADKRAIIVLLFRVPRELLTFLEDLARVPFFFLHLTPHFHKWPTTSLGKRSTEARRTQPFSSHAGVQIEQTLRGNELTCCVHSCILRFQMSLTWSELIYTQEAFQRRLPFVIGKKKISPLRACQH